MQIKRLWLLDHITLFQKCSSLSIINYSLALLLLLIFSSNLLARETFSFSVGDEINIISDKYYRKVKEKTFEAIGNVIITHKRNSLYGEKATISMMTGDVEIKGNVRFITPDLTLYGSELFYNLKSKYLSLKNAKVITNNFIVLGKKISRISKNVIYAEEAEYTTCRDCPESWSIYGKKVQVTMDEYVRVWHAFLRLKGVVSMYIPYIILPIKKKRETGLLFPRFSYNVKEGITLQQPWFWAMNDQRDMTITPSIWGKRGYGSEYELRQVLGGRKWFEFGALALNDEIYQIGKQDDKESGDHFFRHFYDYEHQISFGHFFNHHLYFSDVRELDLVRDFRKYTDQRVNDLDFGGSANFNFRLDFMDMEIEAYRRRNQLVDSPEEFDDSYVQILPRITMNFNPIRLIRTNAFFFNSIVLGGVGELTIFRQNKKNESSYIRNANRYNFRPYLNWKYFNLGPIEFKSKYSLDYQGYRFPHEAEKTFSKRAYVLEHEISFELEKIWGLSYKRILPTDKIDLGEFHKDEQDAKKVDCSMIGSLPTYKEDFSQDKIEVVKNSYRHSQIFRLKHYQIFDTRLSGNQRFKNQIETDAGIFDSWDSRREKEHELRDYASRTAIPKGNSLELKWENTFIKKSPKYINPYRDGRYLRQNFSYQRMGYFNVSQGYSFNSGQNDFYQNLTRLFIETGIHFSKTQIGLADYYYYQTRKHFFTGDITQTLDWGKLSFGIYYDPESDPVHKTVYISGEMQPIDIFQIGYEFTYDLEEKVGDDQRYYVTYAPSNNCWKLRMEYNKSRLEDSKISLNFGINFNEHSFGGL